MYTVFFAPCKETGEDRIQPETPLLRGDTCIFLKYWCRCPGLDCEDATRDRGQRKRRRRRKAGGRQGDLPGSSGLPSARWARGGRKKKENQLRAIAPYRCHVRGHIAVMCGRLRVNYYSSRTLINAGCRPAQENCTTG